jgi:hypothetical protein
MIASTMFGSGGYGRPLCVTLRKSFFLCSFSIALLFAQGNRTAEISLSATHNDSEKIVVATVLEKTGKGPVPVPKVEVSFFIPRLFGLLPIGNGAIATDEKGRAEAVFPKNLPGDKDGKVTVIAKIIDNDDYADAEASMVAPWGSPAQADSKTLPRELWAPRAPLSLVAVFIALAGGVWAVFLYVIFLLSRIAGKKHDFSQPGGTAR